MKSLSKNFFFWLFVTLVISSVYGYITESGKVKKVAFSDFLEIVDKGAVSEITIQGKDIKGKLNDGTTFSTYSPNYPNLIERLEKTGVKIDVQPIESGYGSLITIFLSWLPMLLLIGVWIYFMRQMGGKGGSGGGNNPMMFGRSKAKMLTKENLKLSFKNVAGIDEAKEELQEVVDFLKDPAKFQNLGGKIPKGCLLIGPPGTGKTLLAKAIAGEAAVPLFSISGSDFVEMFVGVGASRVRDMFEQGRRNAPCIIFIDEIDAVGRSRGHGIGGGNDEREQTLNQMLVEMDGFESTAGVIILAATNRPDVLDKALLRPGRFDRQIVVSTPDIEGRKKILQIHMAKIKYAADVEVEVIARGTPGFSGADLANLVNEAALLAARRNKKFVTMREMEEAKDKVMMGVERRSMVMREEDKELTAYHEAGHAIVGLNCEASDPIHKATIIPRGRALGMVMRLPKHDRISYRREQCKADMAVAMGGRVAEELIFGYEKVTTGASSDIKYATQLATAMVREWGMSDAIGPVLHDAEQEKSESATNMIDAEIKKLIEESHQLAKKILTEKNQDLEKLAKALLEYETLSGEEIDKVLKGEELTRTLIGGKKATKHSKKSSAIPKNTPKKTEKKTTKKK